ncbi:MAG: type II secretion system protein [Planctomycetota bacterium]
MDRSSSRPGKYRHGAASRPPRARAGGFSLLELILICSILALVAGGALVMFVGTETRAAGGIAQAEMVELRKAVLRFRKDTGFFPKTGPFALTDDGGRIDPGVDAHWPADAPAAAADRRAWFASPANFYQLFEKTDDLSIQVALDVIAGPGRAFNPETGRGYLGPYLSRHGEGFVFVGDNLLPDGDGDPALGTLLDPVPGVADPFVARAGSGNLFKWISSPLGLPEGIAPTTLGRPYLLFVATPLPGDLGPRIVCLGPNGTYDSDATALNAAADGDDIAVFLLE